MLNSLTETGKVMIYTVNLMLNPLTETGKVRIKSYSNVESFNRNWQGKNQELF